VLRGFILTQPLVTGGALTTQVAKAAVDAELLDPGFEPIQRIAEWSIRSNRGVDLCRSWCWRTED